MAKDTRDEIFKYIYTRADAEKLMSLNDSESSHFQDTLFADAKLEKIAGEKLTRNYIKDTVLNQYRKDQRYLTLNDIVNAIEEISAGDIEGTEFNKGIFKLKFKSQKIECTCTNWNAWHTAFKRFGEQDRSVHRLIFLTCGGVERDADEISKIQKEISSYGFKSVVVKPNLQLYKLIELFQFKNIKATSSTTSIDSVKLPKNFLLLAGISGTGKTRFVRQQAIKTGSLKETYQLVSVRPDWHEPSDVLGYISRISGKSEYIVSDFLTFLIKAWVEIAPTEITLDDGSIGWNGLSIKEIRPFWLCLDEMNLAPVEQYFADFLSTIETREWLDNSKVNEYNLNNSTELEYIYKCDPILPVQVFNELSSESLEKLRQNLGLGDILHDKLWNHFCNYGIALPFNLIVAGTVNMDETTHGFSRKVIDRALTFDFGEFFPNEFDTFLSPKTDEIPLTYPIHSHANAIDMFSQADEDGHKTISFMNSVNSVLKGTSFELAFRAVNEALILVACSKTENEQDLQSIWDDFLMCKVLPRIEGDTDKLAIIEKGEAIEDCTILDKLFTVLEKHLNLIWVGKNRVDLYRKSKDGSKLPLIECRSRNKIEWMKTRLKVATYTSFWP